MTVYGPDYGLADRLRRWLTPLNVRVVEIGGWKTRGRTYATFDPYGSVNHHTAGSLYGVAPSLGVCINGRSDLPGPLCNVHQQRDDVVNVVAAGVANHAGSGGWQGMHGNQSVFGLEVEHIGTISEPFSERRWEISCRVHAAFLSGLGSPNAVMQCQHFEWSTEGKIDFCKALLPGGAQGMRNRIDQLLKSGPEIIIPPLPPLEDEVLYLIVKGDQTPEWWLTDGITKRWIRSAAEAARDVVRLRSAGARVIENGSNGPVIWAQIDVDAIATVGNPGPSGPRS